MRHLDPRSFMDRVERLHGVARRIATDARVEVYHRVSLRVRASSEVSGLVARQTSHEEGLAVRLAASSGKPTGFAAASGSSERVLRSLIAEAERSPGILGATPPWEEGSETWIIDHDDALDLPTATALQEWLRAALRTTERAGRGEGDPPAWVECGVTVETLAAEGGVRASRARRRAWAAALVRAGEGPEARELIRTTANNSHELLSLEIQPVDRERPPVAPVPLPDSPRGTVFAFASGPSSLLVRSLARTLCTRGQGDRAPVGAGFRLSEDPRHPLGLTGGSFDDAGFSTSRRRLADGRRVVGETGHRGFLKRPSFRDPPTPELTTLVVDDGSARLPDRGVWVSDVRVFPVDRDRWVLELSGALIESGSPGRAIQPLLVPVAPAELAVRCVGAVGRATLCANDTWTPTLLFDGLA